MDANDRVARYYDAMTIFYRLFYSPVGMHYGLWDSHTRSLRQALLNHKNRVLQLLGEVNEGSSLLDAGCGCGWTALYFAAQRGCQVTGITLSEAQVRVARRCARHQGLADKAFFAQADFHDSGLVSCSFSHAVAVESSCYSDAPARFLGEMYRVLRPGGRLVVADFYLHDDAARLSEMDSKIFERVARGFVLPGFPSLRAMHDGIAASGFHLLQDMNVSDAVRETAAIIRRRGLLCLPATLCLHGLRLVPAALVPHLLTCISQPAALRRLGSYRLLVLEKPGSGS